MSAVQDATTKDRIKLSPAMAEDERKSRDLFPVGLTQVQWHRELSRCHPAEAGGAQSTADLTIECWAEAGKKQNGFHGVGDVGVALEKVVGHRLQYGG